MSGDPQQIRFDSSLYREDAVRAAVEAHAGLAKLSIVAEADAWLVEATELEPELEAVLLDSLANHALFETAVQERAATGGLPA